MKKLCAILAVVALAGCASSTEGLQRGTSLSLGGNVLPSRIAIADVDRGFVDVSWTARVNGKTYACSADDMVRRPVCVASH
jgi:uncharacterized protein YcfL